MNRPRPVLIAMSTLAALQVLTGAANLADLIGSKPAAWLVLLVAALQVGVAFYVQGITTPLSSPQAADGRRLVPTPPATVPRGTPQVELDASRDDGPPVDGDPIWRRHGAP